MIDIHSINPLPAWFSEFVDDVRATEMGYEVRDSIWCDPLIVGNLSAFWSDSRFATRASLPFTTSWCEQKIGEELVSNGVLPLLDVAGDLIIDLGCGDGRYVDFFLSNGAQRVIALNYEIEPLLHLKSRLTEEQLRRVVLVCGDVMSVPLKTERAALSFAWGMLTCLPDFKAGYRRIEELTAQGGYVFCVEPLLEHAVVYALIRGDIEEFKTTVDLKSRAASWDEKTKRYRVYSKNELDGFFASSELELVFHGGISVLPSLVFGGLVESMRISGKEMSSEEKERLWSRCQKFPGSWERQSSWFFRKISSASKMHDIAVQIS